MANKDHIRPLAGVPDHGFGLLGRLAHSASASVVLPVPCVPEIPILMNL